MDIFEKIIENPLFFKWVFKSNLETDKYWEDYMKDNPREASPAKKMKQHFKSIHYPIEQLSISEKKSLSEQIKQRLLKEDKSILRKKIALSLLHYAAVALLFFSVGGILVYIQMNKQESNIYAHDFSFPTNASEPTLILPDGDNVKLKSSESVLDYTSTGKIVLNEDRVIKTESTNEEPIINRLVIPYGNRSKILLSDGTTVWLNAGSRLVYPSVFLGDNREVLLFGEAYFSVEENKDKPFIVKTTVLEVKVLGTKFNISAYPDDNVIQTVLKEGSVAIRRNKAHFFEKDIVLKPNQLVSFNKNTHQSKIYDVDASYYSIWTTGLLSFDEVDLSRIIKKVERYYNIKVIYENPIMGTTKISGKLDLNQGMNEVFEYISKVSLTRFEKINNYKYKLK